MSAYMTLLTPMLDQECLLAALVDLGFDRAQVEVHATPVPLIGYGGDQRAQAANIVIRRQHIGPNSNDVGFLLTATGYKVLVSAYDRPQFGAGWISQLNERYHVHLELKSARLVAEERRRMEEDRQRLFEAQRLAVHERAKKLGYLVEEKREGEKIRIVLVKRSY